MSTHPCPGGCGREVAYHLFACKGCWYRLPKDLQRPINATWRSGDRLGHSDAMSDACRWYDEQRDPS